eukprot:CAMPEP_0118955722 /NCGR_PEP_ID=MMETSP1169-20130426/60405_1 /TAXON_ID=36882 /ORGANISM="Pyramimonas obovata, Strain CCMP722" /LENGTH=74 /DNA_ID=CAMNT_0006903623 /DNA_START=60 /DNA_END=281 /DNA_ORIENTATION=+
MTAQDFQVTAFYVSLALDECAILWATSAEGIDHSPVTTTATLSSPLDANACFRASMDSSSVAGSSGGTSKASST